MRRWLRFDLRPLLEREEEGMEVNEKVAGEEEAEKDGDDKDDKRKLTKDEIKTKVGGDDDSRA